MAMPVNATVLPSSTVWSVAGDRVVPVPWDTVTTYWVTDATNRLDSGW